MVDFSQLVSYILKKCKFHIHQYSSPSIARFTSSVDKSYKSATKSIALSIHCNDANFRLSLRQLIACCKFLSATILVVFSLHIFHNCFSFRFTSDHKETRIYLLNSANAHPVQSILSALSFICLQALPQQPHIQGTLHSLSLLPTRFLMQFSSNAFCFSFVIIGNIESPCLSKRNIQLLCFH